MDGNISQMRAVVDWSAAFWSGIISGIIFYLLNIILIPLVYGGSVWTIVRYLSSPLIGESILPPPATFEMSALFISFICTLALAVAFTLVLAYVLHRGGLIVGILGGALFGLALYFINFNTLTLLVPWFYVLKSPMMLLNHIIFGILAGGLYETFEVEEYEITDS
ncbi:MAG: hypothetical protein ACR2NC_00800 [Thermodesulfobacteriota bacterium]